MVSVYNISTSDACGAGRWCSVVARHLLPFDGGKRVLFYRLRDTGAVAKGRQDPAETMDTSTSKHLGYPTASYDLQNPTAKESDNTRQSAIERCWCYRWCCC